MNLRSMQHQLLGEWSGTKRLWLSWLPEPEQSSGMNLTVATTARGAFLTVAYTWAHDGAEQEGLLLLGNDNQEAEATAAWVDSWHMSGKVMHCLGRVDDRGVVSLLGSYEAPPGPNWGWRITLSQPSSRELTLVMHNVSPQGTEELAVRADLTRGGRG